MRQIPLLSALATVAALPVLADEVNVYSHRQPELVQPLFDAFDFTFGSSGAGGTALDFFKMTLPLLLTGIMDTFSFIANLMQTVVRYVRAMLDSPMRAKSFADYFAEVRAESLKRRDERTLQRYNEAQNSRRTVEGKADVIQNFPGARFDITQKFEEGFDPDRILTAFTNDLAALGERNVQSGFAPAYAGTGRHG
mgnify:CR=1 FL=1